MIPNIKFVIVHAHKGGKDLQTWKQSLILQGKNDSVDCHINTFHLLWQFKKYFAAKHPYLPIIGFHGLLKHKSRIKYKKTGDRFKADSIFCKDYTCTFYFRDQQAPQKYIDEGYSPLHY